MTWPMELIFVVIVLGAIIYAGDSLIKHIR